MAGDMSLWPLERSLEMPSRRRNARMDAVTVAITDVVDGLSPDYGVWGD
jgi:hypothetical protein